MQVLTTKLNLATRRMRIIRFTECLLQHTTWIAIIMTILIATDKSGLIVLSNWGDTGIWQKGELTAPAFYIPALHRLIFLFMLMGAVVLAVFRVALELPTEAQAALLLDDRLNLKERLITAREMGSKGLAMSGPLMEDAAGFSVNVNVATAIPFRKGWGGKWLPWVLAGMFGAALLMPDVDILGKREKELEKQEEKKLQKEQVKEISQSTKKLAQELREEMKKQGVKNKNLIDLSEKLKKLAQDIDKPNIDPKLAREMINKLDNEIKKKNDATPDKDRLKNLKAPRNRGSLADKLRKNMRKGDLDQAAKNINDLKKMLQSGKLTPEQMKKLAKDLKDMANELENLGLENLSKNMKDLSQTLADIQKSKIGKNQKKMQNLIKKALKGMKGEDLDLSQLTDEEKELLKNLQKSMQAMNISEDQLKAMQKAAAEGKVQQMTMQQLKQMLKQIQQQPGGG